MQLELVEGIQYLVEIKIKIITSFYLYFLLVSWTSSFIFYLSEPNLDW